MRDEREIGDVFICCDQRDFPLLCDCLSWWAASGHSLPDRFEFRRTIESVEISARLGPFDLSQSVSFEQMLTASLPSLPVEMAVEVIASSLNRRIADART